MSPNEEQLRAALRDGAGPGLDPDTLIALAQRDRHARRVRWGGIGGGVAAVVAVATVVSAVSFGGHDATTAAAPVAPPSSVAGSPLETVVPEQPTGPRDQVDPGTVLSCPATPPPLPTGTGHAGSGPLLPASATTVLVCGYPLDPGGVQALVLTGADATQLISSLNDLAEGRAMHSDLCTADGGQTVTISAGGTTAVGNTGGCGEISTGTASAQARSVLQGLAARLAAQAQASSAASGATHALPSGTGGNSIAVPPPGSGSGSPGSS